MALAMLAAVTAVSWAQKVREVHGEYVFYAPLTLSVDVAKQTALERAKIQALADAFGTVVAQSNVTNMTVSGEAGKTDFSSLSMSEVKGEWIETIGEPKYDDIRVEQNMLVVRVTVKGRARAVEHAGIDVQAQLLCNGVEPRCETETFKSGDDLYLRFQAPTNGHLAVYLYVEGESTVYCLLPYRSSGRGTYPIRHDQSYVFFNAQLASKEKDVKEEVDEYVMTCEGDGENNFVYVLFSPNEFFKANTTSTSDLLPRELSFADFQKWLAKCKTKDPKFTSVVKRLRVQP